MWAFLKKAESRSPSLQRAMAKEACILVLDVGSHMSDDDLELGKKALRCFLQSKVRVTEGKHARARQKFPLPAPV